MGKYFFKWERYITHNFEECMFLTCILLGQHSDLHGLLWSHSVVNTGDIFPAVPSNKMKHWKQKANIVFFQCKKYFAVVWERIYVHMPDLIKIIPVFTIKLNPITIKHFFISSFRYI